MGIRRSLANLTVSLLLVGFVPMAALAETTPSSNNTPPAASSTPPAGDSTASSTPSGQAPNGSSTGSTTPPDNSSAIGQTPAQPAVVISPAPANPTTGPESTTGKAPEYAFNDSTHKWEPTIITSFTWDAASGLWISPFYTYDPVVGWYHTKAQVTPSEAINGLTAGSADPSKTLGSILGLSDPTNSNTGPNSNNNSSLNNSNSLLAQLVANASVTNNNTQKALSGDASINGNNNSGGASTGAATVVNNLLNLLNALWTWGNGGMSSFVHNIFGNQTGDVNLATPTISGGGGSVGALPACSGGLAQNLTTGPSSNNTASSQCNANLTVNNRQTGSINNNVDMLAKSGNASVTGNTNGGSARTGDATAQLNIVNLINSAIGSGQSFFGMINIYGNLNGDILFPGLHLDNALGSSPSSTTGGGGGTASNTTTGPNSNNQANLTNSNNANINNNNSGAFNNNIQTQAQSGSANVSGNTTAGSASTGNAQTNTSLFNLFDTSVFGENAVLVIINDMGHWIGRIMNLGGGGASAGALLTAGATVQNNHTGPSSTNNASVSNNNSLNVNNNSSGTITNNVRVGALSGNADVSGNTTGGDASTGNANVATNIANIFGSHLNFRRVFGILLINVFGSWTGSVGIDTAAGNPPAPVTPLTSVSNAGTGAHQVANVSTGGSGGGTVGSAGNQSGSQTNIAAENVKPQVQTLGITDTHQAAAAAKSTGLLFLLVAGIMMLSAAMLTLDRKLQRRS